MMLEERKTEMMGYVEKTGHFIDNSLLTELFSHKSKGAFQGLEGEY